MRKQKEVRQYNYRYICDNTKVFFLGQYDIKKLKKENELLKKEIWCLRDEYEKLDKLLKEKNIDFSSSSTTSESVREMKIIQGEYLICTYFLTVDF